MFKKKKNNAAVASNNPYLNAKKEWLERYGDIIAQNHNLRVFSMFILMALILSIGGNIYQATQSKYIPYVVAIDKVGKVQSGAMPKPLANIPNEVIQSELTTFLQNWRSVTADADLQNRMLEKLVAYSTPQVRAILQEWFSQNNPYKRAETHLVSIEMTGLPHQVSKHAYRAEWLEITRDRQGKTIERSKYEAVFTIAILPPETEADIVQNPLGLMIVDANFSRLLRQE
ncbi:type IV secretion system protein [Desulfovibrio sp. OttesenSCG-928-F07]|nr:type IV secretion system protein [Desulfovibrio sp. OttesenSCG-928-F07]